MGWLFNRDKRSEAEKSLDAMQARPTVEAGTAAVPAAGAEQPAPAPLPESTTFSMPVQDVFSITGRGTVVTGRVASGEVHVDQPAWIEHGDGSTTATTVLGVEMFRRLEQVAKTGENVGLLLRGVRRDEVERGDTIRA